MRTWVEIDKENLKYNVLKLKEIANNREVLGVVKANAYGLGSIEIAKILKEVGVKFFGVANLEEAIELQEAGIKDKILILGASFEDELIEATKRGVHVAISSMGQLHFLVTNKLNPNIHLKFDTGMTRLGFEVDEAEKVIEFCKKNNLNLVGIFSHLSDSDGNTMETKNFTLEQIKKFKKIINSLNLKYIHISNSAGITNFYDDILGNLVRLGIGMYSFTGNKKTPYLKNIFTIKSRVLFIKKVKKDSFVSYGRHYTLPADSTYAVLPIGYADGLKKYLSKGGYVLINNHRCEIIGNICMDMTMIRIPKEIENSIKIGDEVTVINADILDNFNIPELCVWEFMTGIGKRVKRIIV